MNIEDMLFIGIKGQVLALHRDTGEQVWSAHVGHDFVNVMLQEDRVFACCQGEVFCFDALNGQRLWHNPLKGFGVGLVTMAFCGSSPEAGTISAQKARRDIEAASAAGAAVVG